MSSQTSLAFYKKECPIRVSADFSSFDLGAVLEQLQEETWKPVCYASRSLNNTEKRYAQVEKEALAVTWACEKFREFLLGTHFTILTDHKPLLCLLKKNQLLI